MECTGKKEVVNQSYEIRTYYVRTPAYTRLRFALLRSRWWPIKVAGMLVWSAVNVVLVVGGGPVLVVGAAAFFSIYCLFGALLEAYLVCGLIMIALVGLVIVTIWTMLILIGLSWSLLRERERGRGDQVRAAFRSVAGLWRGLGSKLAELSCGDPGHKTFFDDIKELYNHHVVWWWREWVGWCEEVVHMHDTIVL